MSYAINAPRMYKGRIESLVSRITGFADMIQLIHLKLQQVKRPETVEEEAVEMNSTAVRGEGGLIMSAASYVKGGPLIKRKPLICALS